MTNLNRRAFLSGSVAAALCGCSLPKFRAAPRISVFSDHLARAKNFLRTTDAALVAKMRAAGVTGIDVANTETDYADLLRDLGMEIVSMYGFVHFLDDDKEGLETDLFLSAARKARTPRIMVIPDNFPDGCDRDRALDKIAAGLADFTARAKREGIETTVEDFGSPKSPCARIDGLKRLFAAAPDLGFTLDTGNFFHSGQGDDVMDAFREFRSRIRHVHLKDRPADAPQGYAPLGQGGLPNREIVRALVAGGYRGWYTLEEDGAKDIAAATLDAAATLRNWTSTASR